MSEKNEKRLRSEAEILSSWKTEKSPLVSVICHAFQQENSIKDAIESFLMQETDFSFEIIIHDDASTDNTRKIIEEYKRNYPEIIFPILQNENQYSQNKKPSSFTFEVARGEYIALCEGDDYWIDKDKLAKQVKIFKENADVSLCFHPAEQKNLIDGTTHIICNHFSQNLKVPLKEVILGRGHFMPTASLMFVNKNTEELIDSFRKAPVGDYFIQVYMSSLGSAYYINIPMSAYRKNSPSSWSLNSHLKKSSQIKHKISMLKPIDIFSAKLNKPQYNKYFEEVLSIYIVATLRLTDGFRDAVGTILNLSRLIFSLTTLSKISILTRIARKLLVNRARSIVNMHRKKRI